MTQAGTFLVTRGRHGRQIAANLLRDDHGVPQTDNLKLDVAVHVLKRRHQGRETYSPTGGAASDRSLGWITKAEGTVPINMMSDNHLLNSINLLRRNIMMTKLQSGQTSLSLLSLRYMEDEANDRGLNHEDTS